MYKDGHQIALSDFVVADHIEEATYEKQWIWFEEGETIPTYTVQEVVTGLKHILQSTEN